MQAISQALSDLPAVAQALVAGLFTWLLTAVGAATVFGIRSANRRAVGAMLGFAAGIMVAVTFWGLLAPSIEIARQAGAVPWVPATVGFLGGAAFLWSLDKLVPHLHLDRPREEAEGPRVRLPRTTLLVLAITLHNVPEGLSVGVSFAAAASPLTEDGVVGAMLLALGIGIQNIPEGLAISLPLRADGMSRMRSFWFGQLSGLVEPAAAVVGSAVVVGAGMILPYALAFSAGAMLYIVIEELIPEAQSYADTDLPTLAAVFGFTLMMVLDVALG